LKGDAQEAAIQIEEEAKVLHKKVTTRA